MPATPPSSPISDAKIQGGYVLVNEKLPNYVVPDLTDFKLRPYVSQCSRDVKTSEAADTPLSS